MNDNLFQDDLVLAVLEPLGPPLLRGLRIAHVQLRRGEVLQGRWRGLIGLPTCNQGIVLIIFMYP